MSFLVKTPQKKPSWLEMEVKAHEGRVQTLYTCTSYTESGKVTLFLLLFFMSLPADYG